MNQSERAELYREVRAILAQEVPFTPLLQGNLMIVYSSNVHGVLIGTPMLMPYYTIYRTTS